MWILTGMNVGVFPVRNSFLAIISQFVNRCADHDLLQKHGLIIPTHAACLSCTALIM